MSKDRIVELLRRHKPLFARRFGVKRMGLFGSAARGSADSAGDVDIAVEMPSDFEKFFDLKYELQRLLGKEVDLVNFKNLRPFIRRKIADEIIYI
jgi:predicted nucleotidyltransferase